MVPLLKLFLLLHLIQPIRNGNSSSPLSNYPKQHLVFYHAKSQTVASIKRKDHGLAGNVALEIVRPLQSHSNGKSSIKSSNERTERKNIADILSAKPSHNGIHESRVKLLSPKSRVRRRPTHTDKLPQDSVDTGTLRSHSTEPPFTNQSINVILKTGLEFKNADWLTTGSGDVFIPEEFDFMRSPTNAHAQYRPHAQTAFSVPAGGDEARTDPTVNPSFQTSPPASTAANTNDDVQTSSSRMDQWDINRTRLETGTTPPAVLQPKRQLTTLPSYSGTHTSTDDLQIKTPLSEVDTSSSNYSQPTITSTLATLSKDILKVTGNKGVDNITKDKPRESTNLTLSSNTHQKSTTDVTTFLKTTSPQPRGRGHFVFSAKNDRYPEEDPSVSHETVPSVKSSPTSPSLVIPKEPCSNVVGQCDFSKDRNEDLNELGSTNGSKLVWADLHSTLSFAWELHVFGSATLFLLLAAGAAFGLALTPSMPCLQRGELVLTNSLLLVAGAVRAGHFFLDPYGTRVLLPPPVIIALYTLSLPLFILAQAALVMLVLNVAGVPLLPPAFQRPPLLGILAVLQCTLLLAADLLSPALSPFVPVVLQSLTLTGGLAICLWYLFLALPQLSHKHAARAENKSMGGQKVQVLARVLAVCALLGALCCLLHIYSCMWLYGLLGDWRLFRWGWWLCQFWARLLELAWAFFLLLVSSWVFWRPSGGQICRAPRQEGAATENLPSPGQSSNSNSRHTCWAKIVQSLKVRQQRKSESSGNGGSSSSGVVGDLPNNWAGQERSGVDISKNLIRNRDPLKDSNHGRNSKSFAGGSAGSLLRLQALSQPAQRSLSSSLADGDKESAASLFDFDLRPPTPIDLSRSIDEALHREHLLKGVSLFHPLCLPSPPPSPRLWMRRNSDPQITLSMSSDEHTLFSDSSAGLGRCIPSAVPSRQVTAPPTPTHQGFRWVSEVPVPSSLSCPVSLHPSPSTLMPSAENTRPFLTPDIESSQSNNRGDHTYLKVNRHDDSVSISSDIVDL
ncbi:proline-rich transmembrane protein 3 [Triplophysa rosa]|uniref:Proline-rich transmembrane protein 3-like n=1 Tax=Triplophysa rosa TaxID=992332 RepID=A0A9W7WFM3_TRIRA|nr:proline-rich transmembrane protein 3 [Triplophysa rosa]XP_057212672.1 proline-rich transmembrane protein 3 [Triplophysa rosa]KAI7797419.1 putative proline-rich transmembrane protein 3-like [Triplophysa rosa]